MGRITNARATAVCLAIAVGVSGCSTPSPLPTRSEAATPSEGEVLSEAVDAYARYSAELDAVLSHGDGDFSGLTDVATPSFVDSLAADDVFSANKWKSVGSTSFDSERLTSSSSTRLVVALCRDVSRTRIQDEAGTDVTPPQRDLRFPVIVTLERHDDSTWRVADSQADAEDTSCE